MLLTLHAEKKVAPKCFRDCACTRGVCRARAGVAADFHVTDPLLFHLMQQLPQAARLCIIALLGRFSLNLQHNLGSVRVPAAIDHMGHHITYQNNGK